MHFMDIGIFNISIWAAFHYNATTKWRPYYAYASDLVFKKSMFSCRVAVMSTCTWLNLVLNWKTSRFVFCMSHITIRFNYKWGHDHFC